MSLADSLVHAGLTAADNHADEWLDKGINAARSAMDARADVLCDEQAMRLHAGGKLDAKASAEIDALEFAGNGLDGIESVKPELYRWGRGKAAGVLILLGVGDEGGARRLGLASGITLEKFLAESDASTAATTSVTQQRAKDTARVLAVAGKIGQLALRAAIPFLLAAL